ncbi:MAG: hypothetical protein MJ092_07060 [Lachnospiraceae bacterium]|nr:hypothetical protein [Lachnospiraceae bacterium]
MANKEQIQNGIAAYLDTELMPQIHIEPWKQALLGTFASIAIKRTGSAIDALKDNTALSMIGVVDKDGNIDIDILSQEFKAKMPPEGLKVPVPMLGEITFHPSDVDTLYRKITGGI